MRALVALLLVLSLPAAAQTVPPVVEEGKTVRISEHVHVILDWLQPLRIVSAANAIYAGLP